ncbi:hypothetical protein P171DRAFT_435080 [Karstenula rhodostoma CBS 690.94]|uniref:Uncharacterized protein n=1 Tax=Karstenula rhodostoma CBS 690.94 TaxID=1392251 RepID=A0A9P4PA72_9PLEO|nr:hypothetical protein P171DRAFT_435080 [Karstenula rhodostoma CBS 690.94]
MQPSNPTHGTHAAPRTPRARRQRQHQHQHQRQHQRQHQHQYQREQTLPGKSCPPVLYCFILSLLLTFFLPSLLTRSSSSHPFIYTLQPSTRLHSTPLHASASASVSAPHERQRERNQS